MRSQIARLLVVVFLFSNVGFAVDTTDKAELLSSLYKDLKRRVLVQKEEPQKALNHFATSLGAHSITLEDLENYVLENSSVSEYLKFKEQVALLKDEFESIEELDEESLAFVSELFSSSLTKKGSNFIGCPSSIIVGSTLLITTVTLLITSIIQMTSPEIFTRYSQEGFSSWEEFRKDEIKKHDNNINNLNSEIDGYQTTIVDNQIIIASLESDLAAGGLSASEANELSQLIRDHRFQVTDAEALIKEVQVDIDYYEASHSALIERTHEWEVIDSQTIEDKKQSGKVLMGGAVASGILSTLFFTNSNC